MWNSSAKLWGYSISLGNTLAMDCHLALVQGTWETRGSSEFSEDSTLTGQVLIGSEEEVALEVGAETMESREEGVTGGRKMRHVKPFCPFPIVCLPQWMLKFYFANRKF